MVSQPLRANRARYQQASQLLCPVAFRPLGPVLSRVYSRRFVLVVCPLLNQALDQVLDLRRDLPHSLQCDLQRGLVISLLLLRLINLLLFQLRSRLVTPPRSRRLHQARNRVRSLASHQAASPPLTQPPDPLLNLLRFQVDNQQKFRAVSPVDSLLASLRHNQHCGQRLNPAWPPLLSPV